nr:glycosyltransferase [uncultured Blautia sp.]
MLQILWIGCLESDEEFKIKAKKGYDLASAQVSQKNLLYGIEEVSGIVCDSINGSVLPPYPVYQDRLIAPVIWEHKSGAKDISVGYKNDKYINRVNCKNAMLKAANEWCKTRYKGNDVIVFVYSMRSAPMATACRIKEKIPQAKIYLIITDLPQFMDLGQSHIKATLKKIDWQSIKKMQKKFDGFILYAEKMAEYLKIPSDKWILLEGSYDTFEQIMVVKEKKKAVMYSGKLDEQYGIKMLVDAFMSIRDSDIELWITGGGNTEGYIKECEGKDHRIKFYGFLPSRQDVLQKQAEASLLVNMRLPSEPASGYCFPSKLFEYMATGTPVLSFDIAGIPREYLRYLYIVNQETVDALAKAIEETLGLDEASLQEQGNEAREFVINEKNTKTQCSKMWKFVMD